MSRNIKDYDNILTKFVFANFLILTIIPDLTTIKNINFSTYLTDVAFKNGIGLLLSSILSLLLNGIYKSEFKYILVFWKIKNNLPGYRVFNKLAKKDNRFDYNDVIKKYNPLPLEPNLQNKLWYKILKKYPDDEMILQSHRDFLLFRDLTSIVFTLMIVFTIIFVVSKILKINLNILYVFIYVFEYLFLVAITRNKAERFVLNVIAHDLNND